MLIRTDSEHADFVKLRKALDLELWEMYPVIMNDYVEHNLLPEQTAAVVFYLEAVPVACGAFKEVEKMEAIEIKRMYVAPSARGQKLGEIILTGLEEWGKELGYGLAILETGLINFAAHKLYERNGYQRIENYEPFVGMDESWCYAKKL